MPLISLLRRYSQRCADADIVASTYAEILSVSTAVQRPKTGIRGIESFVRSLLRAGVQPTLDPSAETFMSVQCASRGREGGIGRCVRCMCELCRVEEGLSRREQLVRYF